MDSSEKPEGNAFERKESETKDSELKEIKDSKEASFRQNNQQYVNNNRESYSYQQKYTNRNYQNNQERSYNKYNPKNNTNPPAFRSSISGTSKPRYSKGDISQQSEETNNHKPYHTNSNYNAKRPYPKKQPHVHKQSNGSNKFRNTRQESAGKRPPLFRDGKLKKEYELMLSQAKKLSEQSGIPFHAAMRVISGKATLNEVLQELIREEKIQQLVSQHSINRALATSVVLGKTNLSVVLLRRRKNETLNTNYTNSCLEDSCKKKSTIVLAIHGHKKLTGNILFCDKYTISFLEIDKADPENIHKTQIKYAYQPDDFKLIKKFFKMDNAVKAMNLTPMLKAGKRFHFKNLLLQSAIDNKNEISATTIEGDTFLGTLELFGRWEFCIKFKGGGRVTFFRHAIHHLSVIPSKN